MNLTQINQLTKHTLDEGKAIDITEIDVSKMTNICDTLFICTATSGRHGKSLEQKLVDAAREQSLKPLRTKEDLDDSWILVDLGCTVIHIMLAETRAFYNLEQLWNLTELSRIEEPSE